MADLSARTGLGMRGKSQSARWAEESRKRARESGDLPHEFLLSICRGEPIEVTEMDEEGVIVQKTYYPTFTDRVEAAQACANFFAPKLTAQQTETMDPVSELSDEDIDRQLAQLEGKVE